MNKSTAIALSLKKHYMICVENRSYEASLELMKVYAVLTDREAEKHHQVRVIDESGDDYLYPNRYFAPVRLPAETKEKLELIMA